MPAIPPTAVDTLWNCAHKSSRVLFRRKRNPLRRLFCRFRNLVLERATTDNAAYSDYSVAERRRVKLHVACMNAAAVVVSDAKRSEP
nr:hypothetical protein Hi04_10k_c5548_00018 [uncultured bacterium]